MKNKEKFAKEIIEIAIHGDNVALVNGIPKSCDITPCEQCDMDGRSCLGFLMQWANAECVDWSKVAVDTKVLVSNNGNVWYKRYFAECKNGKVCTFSSGATSYSRNGITTCWEYAKLYKEEE